MLVFSLVGIRSEEVQERGKENIFNYLNPMSDEDLLLVSDWNMKEFIDSEDVRDFSKDLDIEILSMNGRKNG